MALAGMGFCASCQSSIIVIDGRYMRTFSVHVESGIFFHLFICISYQHLVVLHSRTSSILAGRQSIVDRHRYMGIHIASICTSIRRSHHRRSTRRPASSRFLYIGIWHGIFASSGTSCVSSLRRWMDRWIYIFCYLLSAWHGHWHSMNLISYRYVCCEFNGIEWPSIRDICLIRRRWSMARRSLFCSSSQLVQRHVRHASAGVVVGMFYLLFYRPVQSVRTRDRYL